MVSILEPGAEAPGYGFFSEININIFFWLPGAAEAEPVEAKHRAMDSLPKNTKNLFTNQSHFLI